MSKIDAHFRFEAVAHSKTGNSTNIRVNYICVLQTEMCISAISDC